MKKEIEKAIKLVEKNEDDLSKAEAKKIEVEELIENIRNKLKESQKDLAMLLMVEKAGEESFAAFARKMEEEDGKIKET